MIHHFLSSVITTAIIIYYPYALLNYELNITVSLEIVISTGTTEKKIT